MSWRRLSSVVASVGLVSGLGGWLVPAIATTPTASKVALTRDVLPGLDLLKPQGPAPSGQVLDIGIGLALPDPSAIAAYQSAEYNPSSSYYHQFLTPVQFAARFGVPAATYDRVRSWLQSGGLAIDQTASSGDWVEAQGTVAQLEHLFSTPIDSYLVKGVSFVADTSAPSVPAGDSIMSVVGLNSLQRFSTPTPPAKAAATQQSPSVPGCLPSCNYNPSDLWSMYDMPSSNTGQGQTLAIFGEGQTTDVINNLRDFENMHKLPQVPVTVNDVGPGPFTDDSNQIEWDLDTQASTGMAPDTYGVDLYFANQLFDAQVESLFTAWVNDPNGPKQANASFGECETNPTNPVTGPLAQQPYGSELGDELEPVAEQTLQEAVLEGRTLFSSAGDTGSSCPVLVLPVAGAGNGLANQAVPFDNYPCASDYAVCVGGTELYSDGNTPPSRALENAWEFTGGGAALFQAEPQFQQGDSAVNIPCAIDENDNPFPAGTICRGAPDVASLSGNVYDNAYNFVENGTASTEGGTSLSSPLWVGMWTRIQAAAPATTSTTTTEVPGPGKNGNKHPRTETVSTVTYPGLGFADYPIYKVGESSNYANDFFDVTIGDNGYYHAATGWDYVSGWGVPDVANLMKTLDGTETPVNNVLPPPPTTTPNPCNALWTNQAHTATDTFGNSDPQLTLLEGDMAPSSDGKSLVVKLMVQNLTATVPTGASGADWYMTWTYNGTTYFAQAQLSAFPTSAPTFADGTVQIVGSSHDFAPAHTDTGQLVTGKDGVVEIDVPLANVGSPPSGVVLNQPTGLTYIEIGVPNNPSGQSVASLQEVDSGGPGNNYTIGTTTGTTGCTPSE